MKVDGLLTQVELVSDEPAHVVAIVTAESVERLGLKRGQTATAVIKATSVMVERCDSALKHVRGQTASVTALARGRGSVSVLSSRR